jgi:copper chaperone
MQTITLAVRGMTCGHCATAVREEISKVPGVREVEVDVAAGQVQVTSDQEPPAGALSAAVTEAGYELADATV